MSFPESRLVSGLLCSRKLVLLCHQGTTSTWRITAHKRDSLVLELFILAREKRSECEEKCELIASERSVSIKFTPSSHSLRSFVGGKNRSHFGKLPQCICKSFSGMVAMEEKRVLT